MASTPYAPMPNHPFEKDLWDTVKSICTHEKLLCLLLPPENMAGDIQRLMEAEQVKTVIRYLMATAQVQQSRILLIQVRHSIVHMINCLSPSANVRGFAQVWSELVGESTKNPFV